MTKKYAVIVAGSTAHTKQCAEALGNHPAFSITAVLTPEPKPIGRQHVLTENPLHHWAKQANIPAILITKKIDQNVKTAVEALPRPDFLLVVDFGYIVPNWLLEFPEIAPLNIHPSLLPRWRGSSPGQFVLLYGEKTSAVSVIVMNDKLDEGALVKQLPFTVESTWATPDYYQHSFTLISAKLPEILLDVATGNIQPQAQPESSPTPIAGRFTREDGYIPWAVLQAAMTGKTTEVNLSALSPILQTAHQYHQSLVITLLQAHKAFSPWPGLWTTIQTNAGEKRMKLLSLNTKNNNQQLILETVQLEGKQAASWQQVKSTLPLLF